MVISTWMLIWSMTGQFPIVLTDFKTESDCKQAIEDVMHQVPKKRHTQPRHGWCVPIGDTELTDIEPAQ